MMPIMGPLSFVGVANVIATSKGLSLNEKCEALDALRALFERISREKTEPKTPMRLICLDGGKK